MLPRCQPASLEEETWPLCGFVRTFGPTRSGTGKAHASGQGLPLIRTLEDSLMGSPQARLFFLVDIIRRNTLAYQARWAWFRPSVLNILML